MSDHMQRPVCCQDFKTSAQNYIHRVWQETWDQQVLNKLHSIHPSTSHWAALPVRRHDVHLTRLRIGHTRFTHRHLLLGENAPECPSCKEENGVLGILCVPFGPRSSRLEEIVGLGIPLRSLWPTLRCRRVAGVSPLLSIGWWYLSSVSPKRHCCRVSAADKGRWVYPLDPRPDAVVLYSECTSGKRRAWYLPDDRHTASLVGLRGGGGTPG
ncbi:uncharacterized protein TNCV_2228421 [Trichonephila clavipes]|nr:uncharacterized protein TNCV_2228421 [Trichonephila clavipes]